MRKTRQFGIETANIKLALLSFAIWCALNFSGVQEIYFNGGGILSLIVSHRMIPLAMKLLHLMLLYFFSLTIYHIVFLAKNGRSDVRFGMIIGISFFAISMVILIAIWPGYWSWDDIYIVSGAANYSLSSWQHFFSGLFHIMCLQTIPFPSGVLIIQIIIASMVVGYCAAEVPSLFLSGRKCHLCGIAIALISMFPPLMEYLLSGFRMGIYSYLEMLLIARLLICNMQSRQLETLDYLDITVLAIVIASWRTEGIFYVALIPAFFLACDSKKNSKKYGMVCAAVILIGALCIGKFNNYLIGSNNYSITGTMVPMVDLVRNADPVEDKTELDKINQVVDVPYIIEHCDFGAEKMYWDNTLTRDYSLEDFSEYLNAYISLTAKHPRVFINCMTNVFLNAAGILKSENGKPLSRTALYNSITLFDLKTEQGALWDGFDGLYKQPISIKLRNTVLRAIACVDKNYCPIGCYYIFWNTIIPIALCFACWCISLAKKQWELVLLISSPLIRAALIFLTSPAPYFMYYLSVYLQSYFWLVVTIVSLFERKNTQLIHEQI